MLRRKNELIFVFRGSGGIDWLDNSTGLQKESTPLQKHALKFVDNVLTNNDYSERGFTTMSFKLTHIELDSDKTTYKPSNIIYGADLIKVDEDDEAIENDEVIEDDEVIENDTFECQLDDTDMYLGHFEYRRWEY